MDREGSGLKFSIGTRAGETPASHLSTPRCPSPPPQARFLAVQFQSTPEPSGTGLRLRGVFISAFSLSFTPAFCSQ